MTEEELDEISEMVRQRVNELPAPPLGFVVMFLPNDPSALTQSPRMLAAFGTANHSTENRRLLIEAMFVLAEQLDAAYPDESGGKKAN